MLDAALTAFLLSGCSLVVGGLTPAGEPFATRGWGVRIVDGDGLLRVVVGAADLQRLAASAADGQELAVTGADVPSLRSVQLKGVVEAIDELTDDDHAQHRAFCDLFFADVRRTDGTERWLMERLVPADVVVVVLRVRELFDQTPGPGAGRPLLGEAT